jgi:hypothetical protein
MSVKLLMNWDIKPGRDQEYFEFVVRDWVPTIQKLGLKPTGAWYTIYSRSKDQPQIMTEGIAEDIDEMREILESPEWHTLHERLNEFVSNYTQKIVRATGGFQV